MKRNFKKTIVTSLLSACALCSLAAVTSCKEKDDDVSVPEPIARADADYALLLDVYQIEEYTSAIKVYDANQKEVAVDEDGSFMTQTPGKYTIQYEDKTSYLYVYAKMPETDFVYSEEIDGKQFVAGDTIVLPACDILNVAKDYEDYTISVSKGDEVLETFAGREGNRYFLATGGDYKVTYAFENVFGVTESEAVSISVVDQQRIVYSAPVEQEVAIGSEITYNTYGYYLSNSYESTLTVTKPSGETVSDKKILFNEHGEYTLSFKSSVAGAEVNDVYKVNTTIDGRALFSNEDQINFVTEATMDELCVSSDGENLKGKPAISINAVSDGSSIYYSSIIDLKGKTEADPLIELYPDKSYGTLTEVRVTLVDVEDPSITVSTRAWQNPWNADLSYAQASANGQVFAGIGNSGNPSIDYGATVAFNYTKGVASYPFKVAFNWARQEVYFGGKMIATFSDETKFTPGFVWNGFTSGKVYLRIDFVSCSGGGVFVKSVNGQDLGDVDFTTATDNNAVCVDTDYEVLPEGVKGQAYPIPAIAENKVVEGYSVKTALYYGNDGSVDKSSLLSGNAFTPDAAGTYKLVYRTVDSFGKVVKKEYEIQVNEQKTPIVISGDFDNQTVDIMGYYKIPEFTVDGGHGNLNTTCSVKLGDKALTATEKGYLVDGKGTLNVSVQATDYLGNVQTKDYTVAINDDVQIFSHNRLPELVFAGDKIDFGVSAINYKTGNDMSVSVYVNSAKASDDYVVPTGVEKLNVLFIAKDGGTTKVSDQFAIEVKPSPLTSIKDYLQTDFDAEKFVLSSGVVYKLGASDDAYNFKVPYYLSAYEFALKFGFNSGKAGASEMTIQMQDSENAEETVVLSLSALTDSTITVKVAADDATYSTGFSTATYRSNCGNSQNAALYAGTTYKAADILFDSLSGSFTDAAGTVIASVKRFANGKDFTGFSSGVIKCSFALSGVSADTEFIVSSICNQSFSYLLHGDDGMSDSTAPILALQKNFSRYSYIGSTYEIPAMEAYDVLSLGATVTLRIMAPDKTFVVTNYSLAEGYSLNTTQYGSYRVELIATDANGTSGTLSFSVKVDYDQLPQMTVNGTVNETYKVGDTLQLPSYTVVENAAAGEIKVYVMMRNSKGYYEFVSGEYVFESAGEYQLVYRAVDEYYNVTRIVYNITVE